ncbi:minor capsid protein [Lactiplantibacillus fabifermentans]|uniref:Minor capsid protein n=1 Tax=Lactiplantibacillus fabifermentans DSM 21115 TaxID=1413187 RepID=A0A0R2NVX1_9LACO|nr:minor capsid protein [Lactiplantibacillus fabifermentans]KRO28464.1 hypothetical protein DY78_GL002363 [Lactiplantibacillus fabifermentans DSM 21115]
MQVDVNVDLANVKKLVSASRLKQARGDTLNLMKRDMRPLIPKRSDGAVSLSSSGVIDEANTKITYGGPAIKYARAQFYGIVTDRAGKQHRVRHYTTDGTGKRWDLRGKQLHMNEWRETFKKGILNNGS